MNDKFLKPYSPQDTEQTIYQRWEQSGFFNPDTCIAKGITKADAEAFSIVLPPPNVTGTLHAGHASMLVIEDIMVRHARMQGKKTLWVPGTDHAAIATQSKVEGILYKEEKKRRHDYPREEFLNKVRDFAQASHDTIVSQVRRVGSSVDWSREAFTLDEARTLAVRTAFKKMYEDGLIYRGYRIVNWDPKGQTTISDDEIVYEERKAILYTFRYSKDFPIAIATTRPETKLGDVGIAVHPEDTRYAQYIGKTFPVSFAGTTLQIKIVADKEVDPTFGTGAVGLTPAHSHTDWEIAGRHNLKRDLSIIDEYGKMRPSAGELFAGKKVAEAREAVVAWLKENQLVEKEEEISQNISTAERTGGIVEPMPKLQWFIDVNKEFIIPHSDISGISSGSKTSLKSLMIACVKNGQTNIIPERFEKVYFHWIENLRDWCISRQIWYGHQIPVWYKTDAAGKTEIYCDITAPMGDGWKQDEDTLDTWFSSGLWTFSTLGWPAKTKDLLTYHPTSVLETGYDILFFWVARMVLMTTYLLGTSPFKTVYLHGLVRDAKGQKMSKSLGNIIDPVTMIEKYGADALRLSLIIGTGPGNDSKLSEDKIRGYKNFANKLWNISRFVLESTSGLGTTTAFTYDPAFSAWSEADKALITERSALIAEITKEMDEYKFYLVAEKLYHYIWHHFADVILEDSKAILGSAAPNAAPTTTSTADKASRAQFLLHTHRTILKAMHPFIPFVTEEIWSLLPKAASEQTLLMVEKWPTV